MDFVVGNVFCPGFCLTTRADLSRQDTSKNRYRIKPLIEGKSKAMAMFMVNNNTEFQVTFLEDICFMITAINKWGDGKREIEMEEIITNTEEKILYHISDQKYAPGEVVSVDRFSGLTRYHQGLSDENKGINDYLSEGRPDGEPCRSHCIYAFDKLEYCIYFRNKELIEGKEYHLYKCKMNKRKGHPMILVGRMCSASAECRERLKEEYWKPTINWHFLEYLSESIEIQEEVPLEKELQARSINCGRVKYTEDYDKVGYFLSH